MASTTQQMVSRGLLVGLIGYASVAAFYAVLDVLSSAGALHTANLLATTFLRRLPEASALGEQTSIDLEAILAHNVMHLSVSLTIGLVVIGLIEDAIRNPQKSRFVLLTFGLGFVVTIAVFALLTGPIRADLPVWTIVVANALSAVLAGLYLLRIYPDLWQILTTTELATE